MIDNPSAGRIRRAAQLQRKKDRSAQKKFLVEGPNAVAEAMKHAADDIEVVYATQAGLTRSPEIDRLANEFGTEIEMVTEPVLKVMTDTVTPQGVVAVARYSETAVEDLLQDLKLVAVLHEVRDPGNAGTVMRAADAAGADLVVFTGDSIDPWHPKVVRASTGSIFHLPVVRQRSLEDVLSYLSERNVTTVATDLRGEDLHIQDAYLTGPTAWIFGNEAHGLNQDEIAACDLSMRLPIFGQAESLNLAGAATVCLYTTAFAQRS